MTRQGIHNVKVLLKEQTQTLTRQLQSLVTVRELTSIETRQKVGLATGWIDIQGFARPVIIDRDSISVYFVFVHLILYYLLKDSNTLESFIVFLISVLFLVKDSNTLESFIVFLISVLSLLLKDSNTLESFIVFLISVLSLLLFFFFSGHAIGIANLRNRTTFSHQTPLIYGPLSDEVHKSILVLIQITVLDLEPNPDFQTFLIISNTYHRIFKCNTSKRRFGRELPFIFFELRAATCL